MRRILIGVVFAALYVANASAAEVTCADGVKAMMRIEAARIGGETIASAATCGSNAEVALMIESVITQARLVKHALMSGSSTMAKSDREQSHMRRIADGHADVSGLIACNLDGMQECVATKRVRTIRIQPDAAQRHGHEGTPGFVYIDPTAPSAKH